MLGLPLEVSGEFQISLQKLLITPLLNDSLSRYYTWVMYSNFVHEIQVYVMLWFRGRG